MKTYTNYKLMLYFKKIAIHSFYNNISLVGSFGANGPQPIPLICTRRSLNLHYLFLFCFLNLSEFLFN